MIIIKYILFASILISLKTYSYTIGERPSNFKLIGHDGKHHTLQQYLGKIIVLEWYNHSCPFVRKHYDSGNMQKLQKKFTEVGVIWLSIVSSAKGKQGYFSSSFKAYQMKLQEGSQAAAVLIDENGKVGKAFGAKRTPEMFILDKLGKIVYMGAIDNIATVNKSDIKRARNYVAESLDKLLKGEKVALARTRPYGCGVKY